MIDQMKEEKIFNNKFFNHSVLYLLNSITIHVILSVPIPSDVAKFIGQILSNIISIMQEIPSPVSVPILLLPLIPGDPPPEDFPCVRIPYFFVGETIDFLPYVPLDETPVDLIGDEEAASLKVEPRYLNLFFCS